MIKVLKYLYSFKYTKLASYNSARYLQLKLNQSHKNKYLYYYGFQILYGSINKGLLLILAGLALGILYQILIASLAFMLLRVFVGGLHFDSYTKCAWVSLGSLVTIGLLSAYIPYNFIINLIVFATLLCIIIHYAPIENKNRLLLDNEKIKFKYISIAMLLILFIVQFFSNSIIIKNSIMYGVLLSGIIATPFINGLSNNIEKKG